MNNAGRGYDHRVYHLQMKEQRMWKAGDQLSLRGESEVREESSRPVPMGLRVCRVVLSGENVPP